MGYQRAPRMVAKLGSRVQAGQETADGGYTMVGGTIRVVIVQASAPGRTAIKRVLAGDSSIEVTATLTGMQGALKYAEHFSVDVMIIATELSDGDGFDLAQAVRRRRPAIQVILLHPREIKPAKIQGRTTTLGLIAAIPVDVDANGRPMIESQSQEKLLAAIRSAQPRKAAISSATSDPLSARESALLRLSPVAPQPGKPSPRPMEEEVRLVESKAQTPAKFQLASRPMPMRIEVLAIGCSTGGPQALHRVLGGLPTDLPVPVVITQHVPAGFAALLAEQLSASSGLRVREARAGQALRAGEVWIAPHDRHLGFDMRSDGPVLRLRNTPSEHSCRPAVDPMLSEACDVFGPRILAAILTGMGYDGRLGAQRVIKAGGIVLAQDEASSVVWGMPGAVVMAGFAHAVVPIDRMAQEMVSYLCFGRNYAGLVRTG